MYRIGDDPGVAGEIEEGHLALAQELLPRGAKERASKDPESAGMLDLAPADQLRSLLQPRLAAQLLELDKEA